MDATHRFPAAPEPRTPPIGSLGTELANAMSRPVLISLAVSAVVGLAGPLVVLNSLPSATLGPSEVLAWLWLAAAVCLGSLIAGCAVAAMLPPFLLSHRDRTASVVHAWIGARDVRRILGSTNATLSIPTDHESAMRWLATQPDTPTLLPLRVDLLVLVGRFDEARTQISRLPTRSPLDQYRAVEALALVDDQSGNQPDTAALRQQIARIPDPVERAEARASLAVFEARRAIAGGDWRAALVAARPDIPESDWRILIRDFSLPIFRIVAKWIVAPGGLLILSVAILVTLMQLA